MMTSAEPRRRGRKILRAVVTGVLVAAIFGFALPRFASYHSVWASLHAMTWSQVVLVAVTASISMASVWFVISSVLPTIRLREAAVVNLGSNAVANTLPAGGALAMEVSWAMLSSWGVGTAEYVLYTWALSPASPGGTHPGSSAPAAGRSLSRRFSWRAPGPSSAMNHPPHHRTMISAERLPRRPAWARRAGAAARPLPAGRTVQPAGRGRLECHPRPPPGRGVVHAGVDRKGINQSGDVQQPAYLRLRAGQ